MSLIQWIVEDATPYHCGRYGLPPGCHYHDGLTRHTPESCRIPPKPSLWRRMRLRDRLLAAWWAFWEEP